TPGRIAFVLVHGLAVGAQTIVTVLAPVDALTLRSGGVPLRFNEQAFPVEESAPILAYYRKRRALHSYAVTPAAWSSARLTATRASWTLQAFWLSGLASARAAWAASSGPSAVIVFPASA